MKIVWVTMSAIGKAAQIFYGRGVQSGGWIDATYERLKPYIQDKTVDLHIIAIGEAKKTVYDEETLVTYHMVNIQRLRGERTPQSEIAVWENIFNEIQPDLIQVWGTEFSFGESIEIAAKDVPVCFYIQGVMSALSKHPAGDLPLGKLFLQTGLFSAFKFRAMLKEIKSNEKHVAIEADIVKKSDGIILDNKWTEEQYAPYTDKFYNVPLAINKIFSTKNWGIENCNRHTLFTVAGGASPIKGIHNAVLAVAQLKKKYPDIKLKIPGHVSSAKPHFLYDTIFIRHIKKLIKKYSLRENVVFLGGLTAEQMAEELSKTNAFVMPSCVETHSSSLREAMSVGCPVVSANVGSVSEFVEHGENGFIYRYDDVGSIVEFVDKIFSSDDLACKLGANAKISIAKKYPQNQIGEMLVDAYKRIINK